MAGESLIAELGLNTSEFHAKIENAKGSVDGLKKNFKMFGDLFAAGGMTTAMIGFFRSMIDHAREAEGAIDENTAAVRRFGDSIDEAGKWAKDMGVKVLGFFNMAGEGIGMVVKASLRGWGNLFDAIKNLDFKGALTAFSDGLREVAEEEQGLAEAEKNLAETQARIAQEGKRRSAEAKQRREEEVDAAKKLQAAEREAAAEKERAEKEAANRAAKMRLDREQQIELIKLEAKGVEHMTREEKARYEELKRIGDLKKIEVEIDELLAKGVENLTPEESERLNTLIAQGDALRGQEDALKLVGNKTGEIAADAGAAATVFGEWGSNVDKTNEGLKETGQVLKTVESQVGQIMAVWDNMDKKVAHILGSLSGNAMNDMTDAALQEIVRQDKGKLRDVQRKDAEAGHAGLGGLAYAFESSRLQQEIANAEKELSLRKDLRQRVDIFGEEGARRYYDPTLYDDLVRDLVKGRTDAESTNKHLEEIGSLLRGTGFKRG